MFIYILKRVFVNESRAMGHRLRCIRFLARQHNASLPYTHISTVEQKTYHQLAPYIQSCLSHTEQVSERESMET